MEVLNVSEANEAQFDDSKEFQSSEVQDDKALPDKNKGRRFKTPAQLKALEDFYNEHKYPTETMKVELADKLDLSEKQISGWFCHRRLKDKRLLQGEGIAPGRQDLSSGVIQDRGSGLKQDSCSSTKQGDYRVADLREVESQRFSRDDRPAVDLNYMQRTNYDAAEMDDTSSESDSDPPRNLYPQNRSPLDIETPEYRAPNGFAGKSRGRVGPSGYLKIKGQTENVAITAVKRQLGRHYREDGPSLGIEFDPLPPEAFESPSTNMNTHAYRVQEPFTPNSFDIPNIPKRPGLSTMRSPDMYVEAADFRPVYKVDQDSFSYRQPKQKPSFPAHSRAFPPQKSPFAADTYSARGTMDYDSGKPHGIPRKREAETMRSDSYTDHPYLHSGNASRDYEEPWSPSFGNMNPKVHRREQSDFRPTATLLRRKDHAEDRVQPSRIVKDDEVYLERRPMAEHHDSIKLKMRPTTDLRTGKRGGEDYLQDDYAMRSTSQGPPSWPRQMKGSTMEMPSSFSEDETAETSSSAD